MALTRLADEAAPQRLPPFAGGGRTHADRHQAVARPDKRGAHGCQLREVQQP